MADNIKLRQWQSEAITKIEKWFLDKKEKLFLLNVAPGGGKTICATVIAKNLISKGKVDRVVVIAPRNAVVKQWIDEFSKITGRTMTKIVSKDEDINNYGTDVCLTWMAVEGLLDEFEQICKQQNTLVICDEHHHAAQKAVWGKSAEIAFEHAKFLLILSGTPIRSDGKETTWLPLSETGKIEYNEDGMYTLTYGEAVNLKYCRPISFHRHEGKFSVSLKDGPSIKVSGEDDIQIPENIRQIQALRTALDFYKLACTPHYMPNGQPDENSYQATMLEWGIKKLDDLRLKIPEAGGLVIAPNIEVAEYMTKLLEIIDNEKPILVHSKIPNVENKITAFKNTSKRWIVSVAMISEGVDIQRLRVLIYLPNAQTELFFRQAMGRVVRNLDNQDTSRAYVVMPAFRIFEEYARRVEDEMKGFRISEVEEEAPKLKKCPECYADNRLNALRCIQCDTEFPPRIERTKPCTECDAHNPINSKICNSCGASLEHEFQIKLNDALRVGAIVRGMDVSEEEVRFGEENIEKIKEQALQSGDERILSILNTFPEESIGRFKSILSDIEK